MQLRIWPIAWVGRHRDPLLATTLAGNLIEGGQSSSIAFGPYLVESLDSRRIPLRRCPGTARNGNGVDI